MDQFFKKIQSKTSFLSPFKDFSLDEIPFEIRYDPLTGETGRIYDLPYQVPERADPGELVRRSQELFCPFCPDSLSKSTPLFPEELVKGGRILLGRATVIPNLIPFDTYAGVVIMVPEHYMAMTELTPEKMRDAFSAALLFAREVARFDPEVQYYSINWNYMPQSGSSLVHPHLQVNCGYVPTNHHRLQIEGCTKYYSDHGKDFWQDFMNAELECGERYIGKRGATFWTMSYLPQTFLPDVWCIFNECHSFTQLNAQELDDFLHGLSRVLVYFDRERIPSFNVSIFSVKDDHHFRINARICPRLLPRPIGNSDRAYLQVLHRESSTVKPPESCCESVREIFADREQPMEKE
jgi:UDPglucose--hexose-1-phosphate uridylyltransferase